MSLWEMFSCTTVVMESACLCVCGKCFSCPTVFIETACLWVCGKCLNARPFSWKLHAFAFVEMFLVPNGFHGNCVYACYAFVGNVSMPNCFHGNCMPMRLWEMFPMSNCFHGNCSVSNVWEGNALMLNHAKPFFLQCVLGILLWKQGQHMIQQQTVHDSAADSRGFCS